jgi:hypothetical protein
MNSMQAQISIQLRLSAKEALNSNQAVSGLKKALALLSDNGGAVVLDEMHTPLEFPDRMDTSLPIYAQGGAWASANKSIENVGVTVSVLETLPSDCSNDNISWGESNPYRFDDV